MREIKFRAWDKINKKMDYDPYGDEFLCEGTPINSALNSEHFFSDKPDSFYSPLMQFTGLKDKNGLDVYEFDFLENIETKKRWLVKWSNGGFELPYGVDEFYIVVGNKYENQGSEK